MNLCNITQVCPLHKTLRYFCLCVNVERFPPIWDGRVDSIPFEDLLFIMLMKLRGDYSNLDLATHNSVSDTTMSNIVLTRIHVIHEVLFEGLFCAHGILSVRKNRMSLRTCFSSFASCCIVLDCTEVQWVIPSDMEKQSLTFRHFKQ